MQLKQAIIASTAALALALAGSAMAESYKAKDEAAAKQDALNTGAAAEQKEANTLQSEADKLAQEAAAARAEAKAHPTAANKRAAELKTKESVDAAAVAGGMEGKAAAEEKASESGK